MKWRETLAVGVMLSMTLTGAFAARNSRTSDKSATASKYKATARTMKKKSRSASRPQPLTSRSGFRTRKPVDLSAVLASPKAILVEKAARRLTLYENGTAVRAYMTAIGRNEAAAKTRAGDWATPEGLYRVRRKNPRSKYYLALHIDYPNRDDAERGLLTGLINSNQYAAIVSAMDRGVMPPQNTRLGYYIEIHGDSNRIVAGPDGQPRLAGWTRGCVGLQNADIEEIYAWGDLGTPVLIVP